MVNEEYKIVRVKEHYEVYKNGEFCCSADTLVEAAQEIEAMRYVWEK
jgi:hypothetical protein